MVSFKLTTLLVAGLGLASAQTISTKCQSTLASIVLSPAGQCLNAQALVALVMADKSSSLIGPVNNWFTGLCQEPLCTNDTLATLVSNVTSGCSTELQALGAGNLNNQEITAAVQQAYPTVRQLVCLSDTTNGNNTLCITETLTNLQSTVGTLNASEVENLVNQASQGNVPNIPASVLCSNCTKEAYNIINTNYPGLINSDDVNDVVNECGSSFTDGSAPAGISQSAPSNTASPVSAASNGAVEFGSGLAAVALSSILALAASVAMHA